MLTFLGVGGVLLSLVAQNPSAWWLTTLSVLCVVHWFVQPRTWPVPFVALAFPWMEIVTSLINAELSGFTLNEMFGPSGYTAYMLSLWTFLLFATGFRLTLSVNRLNSTIDAVERWLRATPLRKLVLIHLSLHVLCVLLRVGIGYNSPIYQLVIHVDKMHLIVLYLIGWKYAVQREQHAAVAGVFLLNLAIRLFSFFSEWTELFILAVFLSVVTAKAFDHRWYRRLSVLALLAVSFVSTWQGVKLQYRAFLNGGANSQAVVVGWQEAVGELGNLSLDYWLGESSSEGDTFQATLNRVGYLDFFAKTVERVPRDLPFEGGELLRDNAMFAFIPRILNPNKGVKDDQLKVEKYAGVNIADHASFSLGRYAEWYVDFGPLGMGVVGLVFGMIAGGLTRLWRSESAPEEAFVVIFLSLILADFCSYQSDEIVTLGQSFWGLMVLGSVGRRLFRVMMGTRKELL